MLYRSDMLKEIERALKDAAYADVRNIYMLLVGAVPESSMQIKRRKNRARQHQKKTGD